MRISLGGFKKAAKEEGSNAEPLAGEGVAASEKKRKVDEDSDVEERPYETEKAAWKESSNAEPSVGGGVAAPVVSLDDRALAKRLLAEHDRKFRETFRELERLAGVEMEKDREEEDGGGGLNNEVGFRNMNREFMEKKLGRNFDKKPIKVKKEYGGGDNDGNQEPYKIKAMKAENLGSGRR